MWALLRTGRWISFTMAAVFTITAFGALSFWQWHRAVEKRDAHLAVLAQIDAGPVPLRQGIDEGRDWTHVDLVGSYTEDQHLVRSRPLYGRPGFWVITGFRDSRTGELTWVARGWLVQSGRAADVVKPPSPPPGDVRVAGYLHRSDDQDLLAGENIPQGQISVVNVPALNESVSDVSTQDWYVQAESDDQLEALPLPEPDDVRNLSYAGQWLLFALIVIGGWFYFLRREARETQAETVDLTQAEHSSRS